MSGVSLGLVAALSTLVGLFLGMPMVTLVLRPITRVLCRRAGVEFDPYDEHDPVMELEGSLAAGLGMALGVGVTVALVGSMALVPRAWLAGVGAGLVAGACFGWLWRYAGASWVPLLAVTAALAGLTAGLLAG